jgi:hypothetical protein
MKGRVRADDFFAVLQERVGDDLQNFGRAGAEHNVFRLHAVMPGDLPGDVAVWIPVTIGIFQRPRHGLHNGFRRAVGIFVVAKFDE